MKQSSLPLGFLAFIGPVDDSELTRQSFIRGCPVIHSDNRSRAKRFSRTTRKIPVWIPQFHSSSSTALRQQSSQDGNSSLGKNVYNLEANRRRGLWGVSVCLIFPSPYVSIGRIPAIPRFIRRSPAPNLRAWISVRVRIFVWTENFVSNAWTLELRHWVI